MKIVSYRSESGIRGGVVQDGIILDLGKVLGRCGPSTTLEFIQQGSAAVSLLKSTIKALTPARLRNVTVGELGSVALEPPIPRPGKILALAGNYEEHIKESGKTFAPKDTITPRIFMKPATCVIGHQAPVPMPRHAQFIDWEGELGVVIGKTAKYVPVEKALQYVFGYTVFHDVSERRLKIRARKDSGEWDKFFDWLNGKWHDGFAPMGPWIVTRDEIKNVANLDVQTRVNDVVQQNGNTSQMIFSVADIVHYASQIFTLEPGDIIATGTPSGVGHGKGICLKIGDTVEIEIEKIGLLRNQIQKEKK